MHHLKQATGRPCKGLTRPLAPPTSAHRRQTRAVAAQALPAAGQLPVAVAALSVLGQLLASPMWAYEGDVQSISRPPVAEVEVVQTPQQGVPNPASSFDRVLLLSIIHATDDLSLAADSLLELTAASEPTPSASLSAPSAVQVVSGGSSLQLTNVVQSAPPLQQLPAAASEAAPATGPQDPSTPHRMSQQALAMAVEALKLATLLEGQQGDGCDPAEQELLQQIAAAARLVSVMAADIVQPVQSDATGVADSGSSITLNSSPAPAAAAEAAAGGSSSADELHSFAGLPVLGLQAGACSAANEAGAAALQGCLHL